jgi:hypothetical protein
VSDEPEYLKRFARVASRESRRRRGRGFHHREERALSAEREATRWAREVGGRDVRLGPTLRGAKIAILVQPITPFGTPPVSLEGLPDREALPSG